MNGPPCFAARSARAACLAVALTVLLTACTRDVVAERFAKMPAQDDVIGAGDWYRPTITVRGAPRPWPGEVADSRDRGTAPQFTEALALSRRYETLALVVVRDGRIVLEDYAPGILPAHRFDTQSMHRSLLALVVGAAIADGQIDSLDAPAARWIPEWSKDGDPRARISIRDLLYGQSGLVDPPYANELGSPGLALFIGTDLRAITTAVPSQAAAGTKYRGAIVEAQALGLILERATGRSYADYLSARLWQPVGAGDAAVRLDRPRGNTRTFCCIQATARDWARIGQLVLERGRAGGREVLPESWIAQMLSPAPLNAAVGAYWWLEPVPLGPATTGPAQPPAKPTPFAAPGVAYAGGRGGQRVYVLPAQRAVVVRIGRIRYDFDDGQFANAFINALNAR